MRCWYPTFEIKIMPLTTAGMWRLLLRACVFRIDNSSRGRNKYTAGYRRVYSTIRCRYRRSLRAAREMR